MNLGDTFLIRDAQINDHLQVVISDPKKDADRVLIVSITSYKPHKETVCLFNANEHPWIRHQSCIAYNHARICKLADLESLRANGKFEMFPPFGAHLLKRIWNGALESVDLAMDFAELLELQGLIEV